ncbi:MAG: hypothetical protein LBU90_01810 [Bacteroidales bacterium]|jgi:hypothetical protein|nr:hypothetical protein [Bacteroidales bacterium]
MYENIKDKSLFDFTSNAAVLEKYGINPAHKDSYTSRTQLRTRMEALYNYAIDTNNAKLLAALETEFGQGLNEFIDE